MLMTKLVSSLEKPMIKNKIEDYQPLKRISALKGEIVHFQVFLYIEEKTIPTYMHYLPEVEGELAPYVQIREVENVPVVLTTDENPDRSDDDVISKEPGLYPDPLMPLEFHGKIRMGTKMLRSLWFTVRIPDDFKPGNSILKISLLGHEGEVKVEKISIDVIDAVLPKQKTILTQWFHVDCLAQYYQVPVYSERHFEIIRNFMAAAVRNGINMILTPVLTPSLDTEIGGERLTTQLVKVTVKDGKYSFKYDLLDRYIDIALEEGIQYFEISHFFTQWGAAHAPKVIATVDGEEKKIFGWDTDATDPKYTCFLRALIQSFIKHMKKRNLDKNCFFHISDEPHGKQLPSYKAAKETIIDLLDGYTVMDALSDYEYYSEGLVKTPIPTNDHIQPFLDAKVPGLWTYYCCAQLKKVSNRMINMQSCRTRSIGMQMFKYDIVGFLQWGFNFYNSMHSVHAVNPWVDLSGDYWVPAGDTFSVYPAADGSAIDSLRIEVFYDAMQDIRAMQLATELVGKEKVLKAMEKTFGRKIEFDDCAKTADEILLVREKVNSIIKKNI